MTKEEKKAKHKGEDIKERRKDGRITNAFYEQELAKFTAGGS